MMGKIQKLRQLLGSKFAVEIHTLLEFSMLLLLLLLMMALEFGVEVWSGNNLTFINPLTQALPTYLALAAPILIIGGRGGKIYAGIMLILLLTTNLIGALILLKFKVQFGADVFMVMLASSAEETREFLGSYFGWKCVLGTALLFLIFCGLLIFGITRLKQQRTRITQLIGVLVLLPFLIASIRYAIVDPGKAFSRTGFTRLLSGMHEFHQQWNSMLQASRKPQIPDGLTVTATEQPILGVIVIGESAMRGHLGIYGYARQTTPELAGIRDLIVFDDVISAWGSTTNALRCLLTQSTLEDLYTPRCSIVDVFRACHFDVALYSNQFRWGAYDGPVSLMFHGASKVFYLQEVHRHAHDWELLPELESYWHAESRVPQIVFLHLIGSHHDAVRRYPPEWGPFNGCRDAANEGVSARTAQNINEYDNSIAYTDHLLGELAKNVKGMKRPAFLFYISDHGDVIDNKQDALRSSGNANPLIYEIPMLLMVNDAYQKAFPGFYEQAMKNRHQPLQADGLFWGMAALGGIRCEKENSEAGNIFSAAYRPPVKRKIAAGTVEYQKSAEMTPQR